MNISKKQIYWGLVIVAVISVGAIVWRRNKKANQQQHLNNGGAASTTPTMNIQPGGLISTKEEQNALIKFFSDKKNICSPMTGQTQGCGADYKDYFIDEKGNRVQIYN